MSAIDLPRFRYHPDPVSTGSVEASQDACVCCGEHRGFLYTGPVYAEEELDDAICPWCIADGRAWREYGAEFTDADGIGGHGAWPDVPDDVRTVIATRTPGFSGWQQERWWTCCGDGAAFLGRAGAKELEGEWAGAVEGIREDAGLAGEAWEGYLAALERGGAPTAYVFRCLACGRLGGYSDCD